MKRALTGLGCVLAMAFFGTVYAKEPDFPAPPASKVKVISTALQKIGAQMKVRQFVTNKSVERVAKFYRKEWARGDERGKQGFVESEAMAPWHLITRVEDGHLMTVQFQSADAGGTWGYLAVSQLPDDGPGARKPKEKFGAAPAMRGSQIVSSFGSSDVGQAAKTFMLENEYSVDSNLAFYRGHYRGWRPDLDRPVVVNKLHALSFTQGREKVNITLVGSPKGTQVVINAVNHDLF